MWEWCISHEKRFSCDYRTATCEGGPTQSNNSDEKAKTMRFTDRPCCREGPGLLYGGENVNFQKKCVEIRRNFHEAVTKVDHNYNLHRHGTISHHLVPETLRWVKLAAMSFMTRGVEFRTKNIPSLVTFFDVYHSWRFQTSAILKKKVRKLKA